MQDIGNYRLGENSELIKLDTAEDNRSVALALARQATRTLLLFTSDLDPPTYDTPEFAEAVAHFISSGPHAQVMILIQDSTRLIREGHRLLGLAQRFSSKIAIRKTLKEYAGVKHAFLVADDVGYLSRPKHTDYHGIALFRDRAKARDMANFFKEVWERSQPDPLLRRLSL